MDRAASPAVLSGGEGVGETGPGVGGVLVGSAGGGVASDERRETAAFGTPVRTRHVGTSSPVVPKGKENVKWMLIDPGNILVKKNRVRAVYW